MLDSNKINQYTLKAKPFFIFFSICLLTLHTTTHAQKKQPNIIFFLVDDLGFADCGFNGGKDILTPNIDQLATSGTILQNHYVQPVCSPTRAALLTGRYPTRTGVYSVITPGAKWGLPLNERTLADALRDAGYKTAITGKWHLGEYEKSYQPNAKGFDFQYGHFYGNIDYFTHTRDNQPDWYRNGIAIKEEGYSTQLIAKEACKTIETNDQKKPLFLYIPFNGIHSPFQAPEEYLKKYPQLTGNRQKLAGMLSAVDEAIGKIVTSLKATGMMENTLIIFSSDNGGPPPGNNMPLRDFKGTVYEGGIRGVAFAHWPGHVPAGKKVNEAMHVIDWYPTLIGLAGGNINQPLPIDGLDAWPMITASSKSPHDCILSVSTKGPELSAIRMGDWKLIQLKENDANIGSSKASKKYDPISLYNLSKDPSESKNLAKIYPHKVLLMEIRLNQLLEGAVPAGKNIKGEE